MTYDETHTMLNRQARRSAQRGFTLTELTVVIVIIAILGTAGFMTFRWVTKDAKYSSANAQIGQMKTAIEGYELSRGSYPDELGEAAEHTGEKFPKKDPWDREWVYEPFEDGFYLGAEGEKEGDDSDDIYYDTEIGHIVDARKGEPDDN